MATSTLRAAIIVAAVVLGAIVLANAFPGTVVQGPDNITPTTSSSPSPGVSTTPSTQPSPVPVEGVVVEVLNGTTRDGLAGDTATCLETAGVVVANVGEPPDDFAETTLLFVPGKKPQADALEKRFFPGAKVQQGPVDPDTPEVEVTIILGDDYQAVAACQG